MPGVIRWGIVGPTLFPGPVMSLRAFRFAFIFVMGLPAHLPSVAFARVRPGARRPVPHRTVQRRVNPWHSYLRSGFDDCDAKMLAGLWGTSVNQAKLTIGRKVSHGGRRTVTLALRSARQQATRHRKFACSYHEAGYRYADAERVAQRWDVPVGTAKRMMQDKIIGGQRRTLDQLIGHVTKRPITAGPVVQAQPQRSPWQGWTKSGYEYCDAKILGMIWGQDTYQAKKTVGRKINAGARGFVRGEVRRARKRAHRRPHKACSAHEAGFSYADATRLARRWRVPVSEAKSRIVHKVIDGNGRYLRKQLQARPVQRTFVPPAVPGYRARKAFRRAGRGYCDAKALGALWRTSTPMAKVMAGHMLLGGGHKTLSGSLAIAQKRVSRTRQGACTFSEAGFTNADAHKLAAIWRMPPRKARAFAERKLLHGGESTLRDVLRRGRR